MMCTERAKARDCRNCPLTSEVELIIPSRAERLSEIRDFVKKITAYCDFDETEVFEILLAVGEAAANAIEHGSPEGSQNVIRVTSICEQGALVLGVKDQGNFLRQLPSLDGEQDYRGRGIPLMLAVMDRVSIDESPNGTKVILAKRVS